jgi:hypothetical protein
MVCSTMLALVVVIAINYLGARHPIRQKWLENDRFELSPLTLGILNSLTNEIQVTVYFNKENSTALHSSIDGLLAEYDFHSKNIRVKHVDYLRDRKAAQEVAQDFKLTDRSPSDLVIFSTPDRFRIVTHQELRDYQTTAAANALMQGQREIKRVGFKGELLFTSAILNIAAGKPLQVAYLTGHGEHELADKGLDGYASFQQVLKEKNFQLIPHHLIKDGPFPDDIAMLIIAGPQRAFAQQELTEIQRFLERGGRMLLLFNYYGIATATGLENLVKNWGVKVGMNVVDDIQRLKGTELAIGDFRDHPVSTPLVDAQVGLMMYLPRSIDPLPQQSLIQTSDLVTQGIAFTSTNGVTRSDIQKGRPQFSHYRDRNGAIPVLTAVESEASPSVKTPISGRTRLLVAGDSFFLSNSRLNQYGNRDFASLAAGWLLDQYQLLQGIGPQPVYEFKLTIPDPEFRQLQILMLGILPGAVFAIGMIVWWRRRI